MNTALSLIMLGISGACLGGVARYRRRHGGGEETLRGQPRFTAARERLGSDQFIYGHDDEPDFNDDHTDSFSSERFPDEFNSQFSNGFDESSHNENPQSSYIPESVNNINDGFLNSFIENNMNSFSKYEEALPQAQAQSQAQQPQSSPGQPVQSEPSPSSQGQDDSSEPSLREFTLLVSKLLFHLSQM